MAEGTVDQVLAGTATWCVLHGDVRQLLATLPPDFFDACVCDPPYELGFMGRRWDRSGVAFNPETWAGVLRVLKPGAHLAAFGGTRTYHRIACAIEDGGFEIRDSILAFLHGQGFPKSKRLGDCVGTALKPAFEPIALARKPFRGTTEQNYAEHGTGGLNVDACRVAAAGDKGDWPVTDRAKTRNVLGEFGGHSETDNDSGRWPPNCVFQHTPECKRAGAASVPANPACPTSNRQTEPSAFTGSEVSKVRHANERDGEASADRRYTGNGAASFAALPGARRDATETVEQYDCHPSCPVRALARQSGDTPSGGVTHQPTRTGFDGGFSSGTSVHRPPDRGSAARYFPQFEWDPEFDDVTPFLYQAKPCRSETEAGLDHFRARSGAEATDSEEGQKRLDNPRTGAGRTGGVRNVHPTKKGVELIRWIARLITPPKGIMLVPFSGSGSEMIACVLEGYRVIGIELNDTDEEPYVSIARARLHHAEGREFVPRESLRAAEPPKQTALFSFAANGGER